MNGRFRTDTQSLAHTDNIIHLTTGDCMSRPPLTHLGPYLVGLALCFAITTHAIAQTSATEQLATLVQTSGVTANATEGKLFFTSRHANDWSCATCHGATPNRDGEHASTGKRIAPLAPAINPDAFTNQRRTDKWFRRNCNDVLDRACTDQEKANILAFLLSIKN